MELHSLGQVRFSVIACSLSTSNLPADLATALATAKENDGRDFEARLRWEKQGSPEVTDGPKTEDKLY